MNSSQVIRDDNVVKKEERVVEKFVGINLCVAAAVKISQGDSQKVLIEGSVTDLKKIVTEVVDGKLTVRIRPGNWELGKVIIFITVNQLTDLVVNGSGNIINDTPLNALNLNLLINGSGNITLTELKVNEIYSKVTGSGTIKLDSKELVKLQDIIIAGSGAVSANGLKTSEVHVQIQGSGMCKLFVEDKLNAIITGSGNIFYTGHPVLDTHVSGSGQVLEMK